MSICDIETIRHQEGEPAGWFMVRLAERNGFFDVSEFGARINVSFVKGRRGQRNDKLACLGHTVPQTLAAWTPTEISSYRIELRGEVLRMPFDWLHPIPGSIVRGCPSCLREDSAKEAAGGGAAPFIRAWWCVKDIMHCHVHGTLLAEVPSTEGPAGPPSYWTRLRGSEPSTVPVAERQADLYLLGRLGVVPRIAIPGLDGIELGAASSVLSWLGELALNKKDAFAVRSLNRRQAMRVRSAGLELALDWPKRVLERLDDLVDARNTRKPGPRSAYGRFYTRLNDDRKTKKGHEGRSLLQSLVREHAMRRIPFGPTDTLFGEIADGSERVTLSHAAMIAELPRESFLSKARALGFTFDTGEVKLHGVAREVAEAARDRTHA